MSQKQFKDFSISNEINKALASLKYETPTEVQAEVIPKALNMNDLIVKSQTGSGKTAAFGIPLCEMVEWSENKPQALVLTPTRELAAQVKADINNIGRFKRVKAVAIYGKQSFAKQKLELKQKSHIIVGTPGRVLDHIQKGTLNIDKLKFLIIDEADEMLNMGFIEQVEAIIATLPTNRMTCVFSATLPEKIKEICMKYMRSPLQIEIKAKGLVAEKIEHALLKVEEEEKFSSLRDITIVENPNSCIIFCRTQERVDQVFRQLQRSNYSCHKIHGGMNQDDRFAVMNDFKKGEFRYLVATDVAARGIDIEDVSLVISYDFPLEKESYIHRIGRTGRAGKKGKAITFMTKYEEKYKDDLQSYIGFTINEMNAPTKTEIDQMKTMFEKTSKTQPIRKVDKNFELNKDIMKLYFNGGKKKKLRAIDFVGTITNISGITAEDIGIISIQDQFTYVDILNGKGPIVLQSMKNTTIKGKLLKVHQARK